MDFFTSSSQNHKEAKEDTSSGLSKVDEDLTKKTLLENVNSRIKIFVDPDGLPKEFMQRVLLGGKEVTKDNEKIITLKALEQKKEDEKILEILNKLIKLHEGNMERIDKDESRNALLISDNNTYRKKIAQHKESMISVKNKMNKEINELKKKISQKDKKIKELEKKEKGK